MTLGIDIGGTKTAVAIAEGGGRVREVERFATGGPVETLARVAAILSRLPPGPAPRIGISAGGLGVAAGVITGAPNLPGWDEVPVVAFFREKFGGQVFLMNDAKACALAEWLYGAGRGCRHLAFLTAGTGMGAGLILDGRLYLGTGNAGEVGHMRLAPEGPVGYGKAGSFEGFCSGGGIGRWARDILRQRGEAGGFGRERVDEVTARDVAEAAVRGDTLAREVLDRAGERLGEALAILIDVLGLERIILGSVYVRSRTWLEPAMRRALEREALPGPLGLCQILPSALGEEVGNYGAVAVAEYGSGARGGAAS